MPVCNGHVSKEMVVGWWYTGTRLPPTHRVLSARKPCAGVAGMYVLPQALDRPSGHTVTFTLTSADSGLGWIDLALLLPCPHPGRHA